MSGGHFQYHQNRGNDIADEIDRIVAHNDDPPGTPDDWDTPIGHGYGPPALARLQLAAATLRLAAAMAQRADWLLSGDDGEESFVRRFDEDAAPLLRHTVAASLEVMHVDARAQK